METVESERWEWASLTSATTSSFDSRFLLDLWKEIHFAWGLYYSVDISRRSSGMRYLNTIIQPWIKKVSKCTSMYKPSCIDAAKKCEKCNSFWVTKSRNQAGHSYDMVLRIWKQSTATWNRHWWRTIVSENINHTKRTWVPASSQWQQKIYIATQAPSSPVCFISPLPLPQHHLVLG